MQTRVLALILFTAGCATEGALETGQTTEALTPQLQHGKDVWFNSTFGGEKFFSLILPNAPFNLSLGLDAALTSPRDTRFTNYGLINDPDCVQGDASSGYLDKCTDPASAGVVGVRKRIVLTPAGPKALVVRQSAQFVI